jgi:hypothetical protein
MESLTVLLPEIVFHAEVDEVEGWFCGYELHLKIAVAALAGE